MAHIKLHKVFMESAQCVPSALERLPFNNTALKKLPVDDSDQPGSRTVPAACFSLIPVLQPLVRPVFVALSQSALSLIGLSAQDVLSDPLGPEYLSGSRLLPGSEPAAHCYSGHQFGLFAGQLGDGAVLYLGEVESCTHGRWEIQVKGAGVTPYSRGGDGRKVLRSSIREFLCSEAMAALGIPSTRAASLVTSDLYVSRDPLNSGHRIRERCSVVLRLAPTFIRFGSFEIFLARDEFSGLQGPSAGRDDIRAQLLDYVVETFYPDIQQAHSIRRDRNLAFFREVMVQTARLVAHWQCVGFCHGVLNTDNMSILGLTLDYGPFGFMDRFDPDFVSNASDKKRRYSYQAQPSVCHWNLARLAEALGSELDAAEAGAVLDEFMPTYEAFYLSIMRKKLGLVRKEEAEDSELISDLLRVMYNTGADFTNTFHLLSRVPWPEEGDSELDTVGPVADLILEECASIEELKVANKPTMDDRELAMILSLAQTNPAMFGMVTDSPGVAQQLELMCRLKELLETDQDELKRKQRGDWIHWVSRYGRRLAQECDGTGDLPVIIKERLRVMNSTNPRVVLRNYIAQNAIQAAEKGVCRGPCTLTFDQNTASESLFLHDGGQQVTWVRERQEHPDHPERFESISQVLCQEGLSQRHYWEVEWRGCWVDVVVAKRGISRRAGYHLSGFGYTNQSWSLYCSDDHYTASHDNHKVEIPAPPFYSNRVGVFLDWPGGTLSFYSVFSWTIRHIHTFYSTFTEHLFPGLGWRGTTAL